MRYLFEIVGKIGLFFILIFTFNSCILDEFKVDDVQMQENWRMDVVSPLFKGEMEFRDLVHDWDTIIFEQLDILKVLEYSDSTYKTIPSRLIFEPATIIDSLPFLIQGNYNLASVELEFIVENSGPFPLNLQLQFFERKRWNILGPPIIPPPFDEGDFSSVPKMVSTTHKVLLNEDQFQSFVKGNRVKFISWFNSTNFINENDTILANYPINILIVYHGEVKRNNEDNTQ